MLSSKSVDHKVKVCRESSKHKYNVSHAEKQVSMYGNTEIGVSRDMCSDCQNYFAAKELSGIMCKG